MDLFRKGRIALLAAANSLVDKVIDLNSIEAVKQHVRDLEASVEDTSRDLASARGEVSVLEGDITALEREIRKGNGIVDQLLKDDDPSNDYLAEARMGKVIAAEEQKGIKQEELVSARGNVAGLEQVHAALETKHTSMLSQVRKLESQSRQASRKSEAAERVTRASQAGADAGAVSIDDISDRIRRENAAANERFKMAMGRFGDSVEQDEAISEVKARIAERRAALKAPQGAGA